MAVDAGRWLAAALDRLWVRTPRALDGVSSFLGTAARDGAYLTRWPLAGSLVPILAYAAGFLIGGVRPWTYDGDGWGLLSGSLPVLVILVASAQLGGAVGLRMLVGLIAGEILVFGPAGAIDKCHCDGLVPLFKVRLPETIEFGALGLLLVAVPLATVALDPLLLRVLSTRRPATALASASIVLRTLIAGVLVVAWAQAFPVLERPITAWLRETPSSDAIRPLQQNVLLLGAVGAIGAAARGVVELLVRGGRPAVVAPRHVSEAAWRLPRWLTIPLGAALLAVFLAGLIDNLLDAAILFFGIVAALALRWFLGRTAAAGLLRRIPMLIRVAAAAAIAYVAFRVTIDLIEFTASWRPVIVTLVISLLAAAALVPENSGPARRASGASGAPAGAGTR